MAAYSEGQKNATSAQAKSTGKGMRPDTWTTRVKSGAGRFRRWMRRGSEGICRGQGYVVGI